MTSAISDFNSKALLPSQDLDENSISQLNRSKKLYEDLKNSCNADLQAKKVSKDTENLTQEILQKIRHLLDQNMHKFFDKYYSPTLSDTKKRQARVYFPVVSKKEDLKSVLGRACMKDLDTTHPNFYQFLDSVQPYNESYTWIKTLSDYAAEKHVRLTPLKKEATTMVSVTNKNSTAGVSWSQKGVRFGRGVSICGVPIDPTTQMPQPNNLVTTKIENWISFLFEDSNINILSFCLKAIEGVEKISTEISKF